MFNVVSEEDIYLHFEKFFADREVLRKRIKNWIPENCNILLDLGCKNGAITYSYSNSSQRVIGIDKNYKYLSSIDRKYPDITFINGDASSLPFKDSCAEVIVSTEILQYIPKIEKIFYEAYRVLKPGGIFIISLPQKGILSKYLKILTYDNFRTYFRKEGKNSRKELNFHLHSFKDIENLSRDMFNVKVHEEKGFLLYPISYVFIEVLTWLTSVLLPDTKKQERSLIIFLYSKLLFSSFRLLFWFIGLLMIIDSNLSFWKFSYSLIVSLQKILPEKAGD